MTGHQPDGHAAGSGASTPGPDPIAYLFGLEFHGHKFGLENIRTLVEALGHPERAFRSLHVAGTNGKGSVAAMCAAALSAAGHRTGCYTSPHIVSIEERFRIDGEPVSRAELEAVVEDIRRAAASLGGDGRLKALPTFFEVATAAAFLLFRARQVDVGVLEVGLGGRLDATNVVSPAVGVITNIDLDHQLHLGHTLAAIADEKAGIVKPGMTIISGERKDEAAARIEAACRERGATLVRAFEHVDVSAAPPDEGVRGSGAASGTGPAPGGGMIIRVRTPVRAYAPIALSLRGRHQVENAVLAIRALEALDQSGVDVPAAAVRRGLEQARWSGRLELIDLGGGRTVLLDGAHNPAGARTLSDYLGEFHPGGVVLVFGAVRDKDHRGILGALLPHARHLVLTSPPTHRAAPTGELRRLAGELRPALTVSEQPSPQDALSAALDAGPTVCVAGSIYLLGAIVPLLPQGGPC